MTKSLIESVISVDEQEELHLVRLIILLNILRGKKHSVTLELATLSKLDFLLRYPVALERALSHLSSKKVIQLSEAEKNNIESKMLYFRYSPWSASFRRLLVLLEARCLITWNLVGMKVELSLTNEAQDIVLELSRERMFAEMVDQSKIIKTQIFNLSNVRLNEIMNRAISDVVINY